MERAINNKNYTYKDYLKFPEGERIEIIDGRIYAMSPAPARIHQRIITELARKIGNYIESINSSCEVYVAPFDVRFVDNEEEEEKISNVVQPDISVICDRSKLDDKGCKGSPDFIIEVVSPANSSTDYVKKLYLYERFKVKEYWIVNPLSRSILVYKLGENEEYGEPEKYSGTASVQAGIYEDLLIDFKTLFDNL